MDPKAIYILSALAGAIIAFYFTQAAETRALRWLQLILLPAAFALGAHFVMGGDLLSFTLFLADLLFIIVLFGPNLAHAIGAGVVTFLDPMDWTPAEEQIALRPIVRMIDKDQYAVALEELDALLKKHRPTYEALLLKAKLLHHFGSVDETITTLLAIIALSHTTPQQMAAMEMLAFLEDQHREPHRPLQRGSRHLQIDHELILFPLTGEASPHKVLPAGDHEVEETFHRNHRWLKLVGEDWGNAEMCWQAVRSAEPAPLRAPKNGPLQWLLRAHRAIFGLFIGTPHHVKRAEARKSFQQAGPFIRSGEWAQALLHLEKARALDPDCYEYAYRWLQAVCQTSDPAATAAAVRQALAQSRWTENEQHMLQKLNSSSAEK